MTVKSATKQELALKDQILINRMVFQRKEYHSVFALYHNKTSQIISDFQKRQGQIPELVWDRSQSVKQKIKEATDELKRNLRTLIKNDHEFAWNKSNDETDKMVKAFTKNLPLSKAKKAGMFTRNAQALTGFMNRKNALGMTVSDNVWNIAEQARDQLGYYVNSGIGTGRSAANIANDLLACLNNPDQTFRRIRDDKGNLIPSKPMANYHPPRGVYKSPYKNALRLSATETNMAYNLADHDRWNRLDFVIGIQVHISNNHPQPDICDSGAGLYSKTFKFMGWHPSCRCYATPVLQKPEDFMRDIKQKTRTAEQVQGVPDSLLKWMKTNSETVDRMKTKPYWIAENSIKGVFNFDNVSSLPIPDGNTLMRLALQSGKEVDTFGNTLAEKYGGTCTPINYKSLESIERKAKNDYNGLYTPIRDAVRNTIVLERKVIEDAYQDVLKNPSVIKARKQSDDLGYRGILMHIRTKNGLIAEVQMNTPKMIYAKSSQDDGIRVLGLNRWNQIAKETGLPCGQGHKYYEQWRVLKPHIDADKMAEIEKISYEYYSHFWD